MKKYFKSRVLFSSALLLLKSEILFSQSPLVKQWDHRFGGTSYENISAIIQTFDGGFILGGTSYSGVGGDKSEPLQGATDYWIVKTDAMGIKQWDKNFGGIDTDWLTTIQQTTDGGYILGGSSYSGIGGDKTEPSQGGNDFWIIKTDAFGNKLWDKNFGGSDQDNLAALQQTSDGGYILSGYSASGISGDKTQPLQGLSDYWIVKTDALGNKLWDIDIGGSNDDILTSAIQTSDGGYILGGYSFSGISGNKTQQTQGGYDYWIVKTDAFGTILWDRDYGGFQMDILNSIIQTTDGGYAMGGLSSSDIGGDKTQPLWGWMDFWIIKTDGIGNILWDRDIGGTTSQDEFGYIIQTADGGYLLSGTSYSSISGDKTENNLGSEQSWVVKIDQFGTKDWDKTLLTSGHDECGFAIQSSDGCFIMSNSTYGGIAGNKSEDTRGDGDYWFIKFCDTTMVSVTAGAAGVTHLCPGTCTGFLNLSLNATSYQWSFPGANPPVSTDVNPASICYLNPGSYDVQLIATSATGADTLLLTNYITVYPHPLPQGIVQNGDTLIANTGATGYQWFYNGNILNGATDYFYVASVSGDYNVVATDTNNCEVEAVLNNVIAGVDANHMQDPFQIISNPIIDKLIIERNTIRSDEVKIYNVFGQEIYATIENEKSFTVNCINFPSGVYFIRIGKAIVRFIKE